MSFKHKAIWGQTGQGKSWLAKQRAEELARMKQINIVHNPMDEAGWPASSVFVEDEDELEAALNNPDYFGAFVFLDEADMVFDETTKKTHPTIWRLSKKGRHRGFTVYIISQYPTAVPKRQRLNCGECYCFRLNDEESARKVWEDYGRPSFQGEPLYKWITRLPKLHYFHIEGGTVRFCKL